MAATGYATWSVSRLEKEKARIEKAIQARQNRERAKALLAVKQAAKKNGFELGELVGDIGGKGGKGRAGRTSGGRRTGKVPPKYRNPDDPSVTWSGRGRQPKWFAAYAKEHGDVSGITI